MVWQIAMRLTITTGTTVGLLTDMTSDDTQAFDVGLADGHQLHVLFGLDGNVSLELVESAVSDVQLLRRLGHDVLQVLQIRIRVDGVVQARLVERRGGLPGLFGRVLFRMCRRVLRSVLSRELGWRKLGRGELRWRVLRWRELRWREL